MGRSRNKKPLFNKKQRKQIRAFAIPLAVGLAGLIVGILVTNFLSERKAPTNLVWAADQTVKIPKDLRKFLESKNECKSYRGANTPTGLGLWGVYQVSHSRFAKIAYGCSWNLNNYVMAIKQTDAWQLIPTKEYFAPYDNGIDLNGGALPYCTVIEKYKIPKDIEPFCVKANGSATSNEK